MTQGVTLVEMPEHDLVPDLIRYLLWLLSLLCTGGARRLYPSGFRHSTPQPSLLGHTIDNASFGPAIP
jgi:hypothetical protein